MRKDILLIRLGYFLGTSLSKKILLVGPYPPPYGGVSSHILDLINSFSKKDQPCDVLHFDRFEEIKKISDGTTIYRYVNSFCLDNLKIFFSKFLKLIKLLQPKYLLKQPKLFFGSLNRALILKKHLSSEKYTDIVIYTTKLGYLIPFLSQLSPNLNIHFCFFADFNINPNFYTKNQEWYEKIFTLCRSTFSSSRYCANLPSKIIQNIQPYVVYVGVDTNKFKPITNDARSSLRKSYGITEKLTGAFIGRFENEMGILSVMNIFRKILSSNLEINFLICGGSGTYSKEVHSLQEVYPSQIKIFENFDFDILPHLYQVSDFMIAPTVGKHACMGVSVKEAMSSGILPIVSNSGGLPEAIRHEVDGLIINLDEEGNVNEEAFISKIKNLAHNPLSVRAYAENARKRAIDLFSSEATYKKYKDILEL